MRCYVSVEMHIAAGVVHRLVYDRDRRGDGGGNFFIKLKTRDFLRVKISV